MYFFACTINTFKQTFTDLQAVGFDAKNKQKNKQTTKSWTIAKHFLLVYICSWSFPNRNVLIFLSFLSSFLTVLFLILS